MTEIHTSPINNAIYAGKTKPSKHGGLEWVGKKEDVTRDALRAVFEHMFTRAEETGIFEITAPDYGTLRFERTDTSL